MLQSHQATNASCEKSSEEKCRQRRKRPLHVDKKLTVINEHQWDTLHKLQKQQQKQAKLLLGSEKKSKGSRRSSKHYLDMPTCMCGTTLSTSSHRHAKMCCWSNFTQEDMEFLMDSNWVDDNHLKNKENEPPMQLVNSNNMDTIDQQAQIKTFQQSSGSSTPSRDSDDDNCRKYHIDIPIPSFRVFETIPCDKMEKDGGECVSSGCGDSVSNTSTTTCAKTNGLVTGQTATRKRIRRRSHVHHTGTQQPTLIKFNAELAESQRDIANDYDMDSEDELWVDSYNSQQSSETRLSELNFERIYAIIEQNQGPNLGVAALLSEAQALNLTLSQDHLESVLSHWKAKNSSKLSELAKLEAEQKEIHARYEAATHLRYEFEKLRLIMELVCKREKLKQRSIILQRQQHMLMVEQAKEEALVQKKDIKRRKIEHCTQPPANVNIAAKVSSISTLPPILPAILPNGVNIKMMGTHQHVNILPGKPTTPHTAPVVENKPSTNIKKRPNIAPAPTFSNLAPIQPKPVFVAANTNHNGNTHLPSLMATQPVTISPTAVPVTTAATPVSISIPISLHPQAQAQQHQQPQKQQFVSVPFSALLFNPNLMAALHNQVIANAKANNANITNGTKPTIILPSNLQPVVTQQSPTNAIGTNDGNNVATRNTCNLSMMDLSVLLSQLVPINSFHAE